MPKRSNSPLRPVARSPTSARDDLGRHGRLPCFVRRGRPPRRDGPGQRERPSVRLDAAEDPRARTPPQGRGRRWLGRVPRSACERYIRRRSASADLQRGPSFDPVCPPPLVAAPRSRVEPSLASDLGAPARPAPAPSPNRPASDEGIRQSGCQSLRDEGLETVLWAEAGPSRDESSRRRSFDLLAEPVLTSHRSAGKVRKLIDRERDPFLRASFATGDADRCEGLGSNPPARGKSACGLELGSIPKADS